jgi:hypothetical protein
MKLSCLKWSGVHLSKVAAAKPPSAKPAPAAREQGGKSTSQAKARSRASADTKSTNRNK